MDPEALRAIADGVSKLTWTTLAEASAMRSMLEAKLRELTTTGVPAAVAG